MGNLRYLTIVLLMFFSIGRIKKGLLADLIVVEGDVNANISNIRKVKLVIKDGINLRR